RYEPSSCSQSGDPTPTAECAFAARWHCSFLRGFARVEDRNLTRPPARLTVHGMMLGSPIVFGSPMPTGAAGLHARCSTERSTMMSASPLAVRTEHVSDTVAKLWVV